MKIIFQVFNVDCGVYTKYYYETEKVFFFLSFFFVVMAVKFQKVVFLNPTHLTKVKYSLIIHTNTCDLKKKKHFTAYMQWLSRAMWKMLLYYNRGG